MGAGRSGHAGGAGVGDQNIRTGFGDYQALFLNKLASRAVGSGPGAVRLGTR